MKLLFIPSWNGHLYLQEHKETSVNGLYSEIKSKDKILVKIEKNNIEKTNILIEKEFENYFKKEEGILSITGDHSNTYPLVKAFSKFSNKNKEFKLIIFDAHPDVEISTDTISHEDYLRNLIENKIIKAENVYLFGLRTFSRIEYEYLVEKKINFWTITDILKDKKKIKEIISKIKEDIYLSVDIDVLDPDHAPGTYYTEWCGLYIEELLEFIDIIKPRIKSADITEYYLEKDEEDITKKNVMKLIDRLK